MQEVLKKLVDLVEELGKKNETTAALNTQLAAKKAEWDAIDKKHQAAANQLSARERIVAKVEDVEKAKSAIAEVAKKASEDRAKAVELVKDTEAHHAAVSKKEKELDEMLAVVTKKNAVMDAREIEYATKFKLMREKVLDELKGKL